ncbi:hypothetical protein ACLVLS_06390 [Streptococcus pneumoniae]
MKFSLSNLLTSMFLCVFSMLFMDSVQKGEIIFSIVFAVFIIGDIITLAYNLNDRYGNESPVSIKITKKED